MRIQLASEDLPTADEETPLVAWHLAVAGLGGAEAGGGGFLSTRAADGDVDAMVAFLNKNNKERESSLFTCFTLISVKA